MSNGAAQHLHRLKNGFFFPPSTRYQRHCVADTLTYLAELNRLKLTGHPASLEIFHTLRSSLSPSSQNISNHCCSAATINSVDRLSRHAENILSSVLTDRNHCQATLEDKSGPTSSLFTVFFLKSFGDGPLV